MPFRHAREILTYWQSFPPENEMLVVLAQVYTTWRPQNVQPMTEEEHRQSLERRWGSGQAMSPKQMLEAFGGGNVSIGRDGVFRGADGRQLPGSHPFPGMH